MVALAETQTHEDEEDILFGIINRYLGFHTRESQQATRNDTSREYPFVPMDTRQAYDQIRLVTRFLQARPEGEGKSAYSFLDVGCGTGNIMVIAEQFGFEVFGLEKDEHPFQVAKRFMGVDRVVQEDIWTYADYGRYDVVYYFCPFSDGETQRRFERMVEERMRPGAILIANQKRSELIASDPRFRRLHDTYQIWEKLSA